MIYRLEVLLRRTRQWFSRSEWMIRLLGLSRSMGSTMQAGLVMIQIDGLSRTQLQRALDDGRMPFLKHLLEREHYHTHTLYSGLPSSTPAVQGELFYGVKCATPAFSVKDCESGDILRMYEPGPVANLERYLESQGEPLLKDGSSYSNIFTGGAAESHYCVASAGWGELQTAPRPLPFILLMLFNLYGIARTLVLLLVEIVLAGVDFVRGIIGGRDLLHELKFVPARVAICILLRELVTAGVKIDVARGLPIIHLNFLGYDEQSHRRGPTSLFAHWSLKGIDDAIARIWRAAKRSGFRDYAVWIYSDHGQEETIPYPLRNGQTIQQAVAQAFSLLGNRDSQNLQVDHELSVQTQRSRLLGGRWLQRLLPMLREKRTFASASDVVVTAMGPVGMIYCQDAMTLYQRQCVAEQLVQHADVPLVLAREQAGKLRAWCKAGEYMLPEDSAKVFGDHHPFLEELGTDIVRLCQHPNAGELVIMGWCNGALACSFPIESGAHAGAGPEESRAFALLPADTVLPQHQRSYLRPLDMRQAALHYLRRQKITLSSTPSKRLPQVTQALRIMTYNVHSCVGMDAKLSCERIARVIAQYKPDVVALQEIDVGRQRTDSADQAALISDYLRMKFHFHPTIHLEDERYGDAILTHLPMRLIKADRLPEPVGKPLSEARGAIWVAVDVNGTEVQVINTHFGLLPGERSVQAEALLSGDWLGHPKCRKPVVLCGDFNAGPGSTVCRRLGTRLRDVQLELEAHRPKKTFFGRYPTFRIDHIFADPDVKIVHIEVPSTQLTRVASDHLPLIVDVQLPIND